MSKLDSKNLIVLCDGTANQVNVHTSTNVVRMANRIDKTDKSGRRQVVFYDPGLGTENAPGALTVIGRSITKVLGLAFGYGLGKNLADAYAFLMQNYEPGDRIYIFGFSRGAYTARALTGLLGRVGLLDKGCNSLIPYAIKYYREGNTHQLNFFKKRFSRTYALKWGEVIKDMEPWFGSKKEFMEKDSKGVIPVHFLGVWDTVKSIGLLRGKAKLSDTEWMANMINGRHAVAIHEQRSQYKPELWDADTEPIPESETESEKRERKEAKKQKIKDQQTKARKEDKGGVYQTCLHQDVKTRWFPGVHADVGGGYGLSAKEQEEKKKGRVRLKKLIKLQQKAKDGGKLEEVKTLTEEIKILKTRITDLQRETALAYFSLKWMTDAAEAKGLRIEMEKDEEEEEKEFLKIKEIKPHNPLLPFWWILGWKDREPGVIE
jgi:uncharacterized protein (DUF2235 family)